MPCVLIYGAESSVIKQMGDRVPDSEVLITRNAAEVKKHICYNEITMIIIDLEWREKKGVELADYIRQVPRQCMTPILFLANNRKLEWWAFHEIHCYDYIIKPIAPMQIMQILVLCMKRMADNEKNRPIIFTVGKDRYPIYPREILYLDRTDRSVTIHTTTINLRVPSLSLGEFVDVFGEQFVRIHRGTVVNRSYIRCIDLKNMVLEMKNGCGYLDIGRTYIGAVRKEFDETNFKLYNTGK
ncbi:MAG: response regulator transcription factor [Eubacterium sp.]|nr:response regulator transcription factor [Eubacterium sp.]